MFLLMGSDFLAEPEIVYSESDPAGGQDGDAEDDLPEKVQGVLLEDVEHAPYGGHDTEDVNDFSHNKMYEMSYFLP
jgi:hypothetical protein